MSIGRTVRVTLVAAALAAFSTNAFAVDPSVFAAAKKEGVVVWYTGMIVNQIVRPMVQAFEAKYPGVKVEAARHVPSEIVLTVESAAQAHRQQIDVFDGSSAVFPLITAGLVQPYKAESAALYQDSEKDKDGYWTASNLYFMVPAVNTTLVVPKDYPTSFADLLNPRWKGKMAWTSDPTTLGPPGFIMAALHTLGETKGMDYLKQLAAQRIVNVPASQRVVLDKVISGEFPLGLMTFNNHSVLSRRKGAPVQWIKFDPVLQAVNPLGIVKDAPHPNAARLLVEFILSEEGQQVFSKALYIPANPKVDAADPALKPASGHFKTFVITPEATADELPRVVPIYDKLFK
jgi:iron(III) transport system substrate-binding protein